MTERIGCRSTSGPAVGGDLAGLHGPLMSGRALWRALGFTSAAAFRQAKLRRRLSVRVFSLPERRGTFAFTQDVEGWLNALAAQTALPELRSESERKANVAKDCQ